MTSALEGRGIDEGEARALVQQVAEHRYNLPGPTQIMEWQQHQDFPLCPSPDDPDACNVYRDRRFAEAVYADIQAYREQRFEAGAAESATSRGA